MAAGNYGHKAMVEFLLSRGADINATVVGNEPPFITRQKMVFKPSLKFCCE